LNKGKRNILANRYELKGKSVV